MSGDVVKVPSGSKLGIGFSRAVRVGDLVFVSGCAPIAADGSVAAPGDVKGQTKRCLQIIEAALAQAGADIRHVVRTRVFLTDMTRWKEPGRPMARCSRTSSPPVPSSAHRR
jgi:enamine deaminase RidA (YjgF/YER057c/UK114 family)